MIEAGSFEELDTIMNRLPFFGLVKWQVKPVTPFTGISSLPAGYIQEFRQQLKSGQPG